MLMKAFQPTAISLSLSVSIFYPKLTFYPSISVEISVDEDVSADTKDRLYVCRSVCLSVCLTVCRSVSSPPILLLILLYVLRCLLTKAFLPTAALRRIQAKMEATMARARTGKYTVKAAKILSLYKFNGRTHSITYGRRFPWCSTVDRYGRERGGEDLVFVQVQWKDALNHVWEAISLMFHCGMNLDGRGGRVCHCASSKVNRTHSGRLLP